MKKIKKRDLYFLSVIVFIFVTLPFTVNCSGHQPGTFQGKTGFKEFANGRLEYHFNIPFLYLKGNEYEVGLQYGNLLKAELNYVAKTGLVQLIDEMIQGERDNAPALLKPLVKPIAKYTFGQKRRKIKKKLPDEIHQRIEGMAEGSDLPKKFFYDVFVLADYIAGCFSFIINTNDRMIHARNFDTGRELLGLTPVVVSYEIIGKLKYVQLGNPGLIWSYSAVNEAGISFTEESNNNPQKFEDKNRSPLIGSENVLWYAKNMNEVDSILNNFKSPNDFILNYASATENRATLYDMIGGEVRGKTEVPDRLCGSGGIRDSRVQKKHESIIAARYHNIARELKFDELYDSDTTLNPIDKAINIISNTDFYNLTKKPEVYFESIHNYQTTQSVVFDAKNSKVYFTYHPYFAAWSDWYKFDYSSNEISLYKEKNPLLETALVKDFVKACQMKNAKSWENEEKSTAYVKELESMKNTHLFAIKDLVTYYLFYQPDFVKAKSNILKLLQDYPEFVFGNYYLGRYYQLKGESETAIKFFKEALTTEHQTDYWQAAIYEKLAEIYDDLEKHDLKKAAAKDALKIYNQYWWRDSKSWQERRKILESWIL